MKTLHSISLKALALALMTGSVSAADLPSKKVRPRYRICRRCGQAFTPA